MSNHWDFSEIEMSSVKPNGIRSSQVGIWIPQTRNAEGTHNIFVNNVVSRSSQADAVNLHGNVHDAPRLPDKPYFRLGVLAWWLFLQKIKIGK